MQNRSSLTVTQIDQIFHDYLYLQQSLDSLINTQLSTNITLIRQSITISLVQRVRDFLLELEKNLFVAKKITQLLIYDHDSKQLYQPILINLKTIIAQNMKSDVLQMYKNTILNPMNIIFTMQSFIHSNIKHEIYDSIIKYLQQTNIFQKVRLTRKDKTQQSPPYQNPIKVFPQRDHQFIYKIFLKCINDPILTFQTIKQFNLVGKQYLNKIQFITRLDNLLLIGVYLCYREICLQQNIQVDHWRKFITRKHKNINFQPFYHILLRIAIRNDGQLQQMRNIFNLIQRKSQYRFNPKTMLNSQKVRYEQLSREKQKQFQHILQQQMEKICQLSGPHKKIKIQHQQLLDQEHIS